jgi:prevent-host-death family protein
MAVPRFSEDVRSLSDLKKKAAEILRQVARSRRPVLVTRRGRGVAVLLDLAEYELLVDRAAFAAAVETGLQSAASGDLHSNAEAMRLLDSFGEPDA